MKAAYIDKKGPPENIIYGDLPEPKTLVGHVLVKVTAVAANHVDGYIRSGVVPVDIPLPFILGRDMVGVVEHVGAGVKDFHRGDKVWSNCLGVRGQQGTFAEKLSCEPERLFHLPKWADERLAVASMHSGLTAVIGLFDKAQIKKGETVFVRGGSGNVGTAVIQLAKSVGAKVVSTAGSEEKARRCHVDGADAVILYKEEDISTAIKKVVPEGINIWWDITRKADVDLALQHLNQRGRLILVSGRGQVSPLDIGRFYGKDISAYGYVITNLTREELYSANAKINDAWIKGILRPHIAAVLPLSETAQAHRLLENEAADGKLVLVP